MGKVSFAQKAKNKKKGFTLVELIIVIAVIAILAAMAIPKFSAIRTDAKVSNDVAAAKNIHTIAATLVANGTWKAGDSKESTDKEITDRLDGKIAKNGGLAEASGKEFKINIASNEDITIVCNDCQLYPEEDGERAKYLEKVTGNGKSESKSE